MEKDDFGRSHEHFGKCWLGISLTNASEEAMGPVFPAVQTKIAMMYRPVIAQVLIGGCQNLILGQLINHIFNEPCWIKNREMAYLMHVYLIFN